MPPFAGATQVVLRRLLRWRGRSSTQPRRSIVSVAAALAIVGVLLTQNHQAFALNDRSHTDAADAASRRYARLVDRATNLMVNDPTIGMLDLRRPSVLRAMLEHRDPARPPFTSPEPASEPARTTKPHKTIKPHKTRDGRQPSRPTIDAVSPWRNAHSSSWYGPSFYGNRTACGQVYTRRIVGVAHRTLPCGTLVQLKWRGMTVIAPVIDRGPYGNPRNVFDFSAALACDKFRPRGQKDGCFTRHGVQWRVIERRR